MFWGSHLHVHAFDPAAAARCSHRWSSGRDVCCAQVLMEPGEKREVLQQRCKALKQLGAIFSVGVFCLPCLAGGFQEPVPVLMPALLAPICRLLGC